MKVHFELRGTQDMLKTFIFAVPFLTWTTQVSIIIGVGKRTQIYMNWTSKGVTIGGDAEKSDKNNHLIVIMRMR